MLIQTFVELLDSSLFLVVSGALLGVVGDVDGFVGVVGEPIRQTLLAEMQEFPHGIPFLQFVCASARNGRTNRRNNMAFVNRFIESPRLRNCHCGRSFDVYTKRFMLPLPILRHGLIADPKVCPLVNG